MALCCVGHSLVLALGFAGLGAALGAITGSTVVLMLTAGLLLVLGVVALRRARHRRHASDPDQQARHERTLP